MYGWIIVFKQSVIFKRSNYKRKWNMDTFNIPSIHWNLARPRVSKRMIVSQNFIDKLLRFLNLLHNVFFSTVSAVHLWIPKVLCVWFYVFSPWGIAAKIHWWRLHTFRGLVESWGSSVCSSWRTGTAHFIHYFAGLYLQVVLNS